MRKLNEVILFHDLYLDLYKLPTNPPSFQQSSISTTTQESIVAPQKSGENNGVNEPKVSSQKMSPISQNETKTEDVGIDLNVSKQPPDHVEEATVNLSIEMIYLILIGKNFRKY